MKWSHLPWPGALSDQHPEFIDAMMFMFGEVDKAEAERDAAERAKQKSGRH